MKIGLDIEVILIYYAHRLYGPTWHDKHNSSQDEQLKHSKNVGGIPSTI